MDRPKKKSKKTPPQRGDDKNKSPGFSQDLKTIKENLRISEILRSVKISSSFRIKGPKGTKVMTEAMNDIPEKHVDGDSYNDSAESSNMDREDEKLINTDVPNIILPKDEKMDDEEIEESENLNSNQRSMKSDFSGTSSTPEIQKEFVITPEEQIQISPKNEDADDGSNPDKPVSNGKLKVLDDIYEGNSTIPRIKSDLKPSRKLSLDNTMLRRRESLSKSEMDLNLVGRVPLQRKSSFFRKKLDSFVKNTSEVFKRQASMTQGPEERRNSMSYSLQSLTDKNVFLGDVLLDSRPQAHHGSSGSVSTTTGSFSSLAESQQSQSESIGSRPDSMRSSMQDNIQGSIQSLNDLYLHEAMMSGRAISVSSGLDSVHRPRRSHSINNNRYTWLASDTVADYLRRRVEDEQRALHASHSFQDGRRGPGADTGGSTLVHRVDSKGRRLSYQRAVSGEDPVLPARQFDAGFRRRNRILANAEFVAQSSRELAAQLEEFSRSGVPPLKGFVMAPIGEEALRCISWSESLDNLDTVTDWSKLDANELERQSVIKELIATEAGHISHLRAVVEVFMAAAHALQDAGKLLTVDTAKLFSNIPDVLNASLFFWNSAYQPMVQQAIFMHSSYDPGRMFSGFQAFNTVLEPYEQFVGEQRHVNDYLRSLQADPDFLTYLTWCQSKMTCSRLLLSDLLAKPMQRLTKYTLLLDRIILHTDDAEEKDALVKMRNFTKTYVLDVNRRIRQKEEVEKVEALADIIEDMDLNTKDEDMLRHFRMHSGVNLRAPMPGCLPNHRRSLIHQGDLRLRDHKDQKMDVRALLMTDLFVITKKNKTLVFSLKVVRPKYIVNHLYHYPQFKNPKNSKEISSIVCVVTDCLGSAFTCFSLTDPNKDNPNSLKVWEQKFREAKLSYELSMWFAQNALVTQDVFELDPERAGSGLTSSEEISIEREARERVVTMLPRVPGTNEIDFSDLPEDDERLVRGGPRRRFPFKRASTGGSSRHSRFSSLQQSSVASHEEAQGAGAASSRSAATVPRYSYACGSSVEHIIAPSKPDEEPRSITVNVMSENEPDMLMALRPAAPQPHCPSMPGAAGAAPGAAAGARSQHTLRVQPALGAMSFVHSLPDLTLELTRDPRRQPQFCGWSSVHSGVKSTPKSASERLYAAHQESLQRNRLAAAAGGGGGGGHFLSPDNRGISYPPPSPTRASLRRSMAFSYSFKNPPLAKMGHVKSESHQQPSESHYLTPVIAHPAKSTGFGQPTQPSGFIQSTLSAGVGQSSQPPSIDRRAQTSIHPVNQSGPGRAEPSQSTVEPAQSSLAERSAVAQRSSLMRQLSATNQAAEPSGYDQLAEPRRSRDMPQQSSPDRPSEASGSRVATGPAANEEGAINEILIGSEDKKKKFLASTFFTSGGWYGKVDG